MKLFHILWTSLQNVIVLISVAADGIYMAKTNKKGKEAHAYDLSIQEDEAEAF